MNILLTLEFVFIISAAIIAIFSQVKPAPILWIAVILLCIAEAMGHAGALR